MSSGFILTPTVLRVEVKSAALINPAGFLVNRSKMALNPGKRNVEKLFFKVTQVNLLLTSPMSYHQSVPL